LRGLALAAFVCTLLYLSSYAHAQELNIAFGDSITLSPQYHNSSLSYPPPQEKGGEYPSGSVEYLFANHPVGFSAEIAGRYGQGLYNGFQKFRPVLYDVNAVFAPHIRHKMDADVMAGFGGETLIFYNQYSGCGYTSCTPFTNSNHFMGHISGDVRYYFWHNFFVRPEAHVYFIHNNFQFNSAYFVRVGGSVGYSFGR
jgi:hypothetical protein